MGQQRLARGAGSYACRVLRMLVIRAKSKRQRRHNHVGVLPAGSAPAREVLRDQSTNPPDLPTVLVLAVVVYQAVGGIDGRNHCIKGRLGEHKVAEGRGCIDRTQLARRRECARLHRARRACPALALPASTRRSYGRLILASFLSQGERLAQVRGSEPVYISPQISRRSGGSPETE